MIGALAGIGLLMSYLGVAWSGSNSDSPFGSGILFGLAVIGFWFLLGLFLFPRTVGMAFTPSAFATPIAFLIGWLKNGFQHGISMLVLGFACFAAQFLIGRFRPESA
jgi:hypothetical protein